MTKMKWKRKVCFIFAYTFAGVIFLLGLLTFLYPLAARRVSKSRMNNALIHFNEVAEQASLESTAEGQSGDNSGQVEEGVFSELKKEMEAYNQEIYAEGQAELKDPFDYEEASFDLTKYGLEENVAANLYIPRLELSLPVYLGASKENMSKGAAQMGNTSVPVGGENTNCVIAAHRGMSKAEMFRNIQKIEIGDMIYIKNFWETLAYEVVEVKIIKPTEIKEVLIQPGKDMVTLLTCHPYLHNYQRYLVYCERVK